MDLRKRQRVRRPFLFPVSFKYQMSETEREIDEESTSQGMMKPHPSPSLALPLACSVADCRGKNHFRMVPALSLADIVKDNG